MTFFEEQFVSTLRRLVREKPDFVYQLPEIWSDHDQDFVQATSCQYIEDNHETEKLCGSCLIGQVLVELGVSMQELFHGDDGKMNSRGFGHLAHDLGLPLREEVIDWAAAIQRRQDNNTPWGEALRSADTNRPIDL